MESIEKEWNNKRINITKIVEEITGEKLSDIKIDVLITHPKLCNGMALPNSDTICWGHKENWDNYSMVYLMHETLHLILDKKLGKNNLTHAIIELIADQELRIRLNKNGIYFKESKEGVGHPFLIKLSKVLLPYWKKYLKIKDKNIANFYLEMKNLSKIKKFLELKNKALGILTPLLLRLKSGMTLPRIRITCLWITNRQTIFNQFQLFFSISRSIFNLLFCNFCKLQYHNLSHLLSLTIKTLEIKTTHVTNYHHLLYLSI